MFETLVKNADNTFTLTQHNQVKVNYAALSGATAGKFTSMVDSNGNTVTPTYNAAGELIEVKEASGRKLTLVYTSGRLTQVTAPNNLSVRAAVQGGKDMKNRPIIWLAAVLAMMLCAVSGNRVLAQSTPEFGVMWGGFFNARADTSVRYPVPRWATVRSIDFSVPQVNTGELSVLLGAPLPRDTKDRFTLEVYFDTPEVGPFDTAVVFSHGSYAYASEPPIDAGSAGVVLKLPGNVFVKMDTAQIGHDRNRITLRFDLRLVQNRAPSLFVSRYLPARYELSEVSGGFSSCVVKTAVLESRLSRSALPLPYHPNTTPVGFVAAAASQIIRFGPDDVVPPQNTPPSQDLDGDGDLDHNLTLNGGSGFITHDGYIIDIWVVDGDYILILGDDDDGDGTLDDNGNGMLDSGEFYIIGECIYNPGLNDWYIEDGIIHHVNWFDTDRDGILDPTETITHYIYDPSRNKLKVYRDVDGRGGPTPADLLYCGNPIGYDWQAF